MPSRIEIANGIGGLADVSKGDASRYIDARIDPCRKRRAPHARDPRLSFRGLPWAPQLPESRSAGPEGLDVAVAAGGAAGLGGRAVRHRGDPVLDGRRSFAHRYLR